MKKTVTVKGVTIGEGAPKICVSMVGETVDQLLEEAIELSSLDVDVIEWRVDFFDNVGSTEMLKTVLKEIRRILQNKPLLFTFRSAKEGGEKELSTVDYMELNKAIVETGQVDFIDVELFTGDDEVRSLIHIAHKKGVHVIVSNHDFTKTPSKEEIISRLCKAQDLGGDIPKIAVMPTCTRDVLTLLDATLTMKEQFANRPIITMSMAGKGVISRLSGEVFGSALTFGAAKKASAPGQVAVAELRQYLALINKSL